MSALLFRLAFTAALVATPVLAASDADTADKKEASTETTSESGNTEESDDSAAGRLAGEDAEWAAKLKKRHHEGDVALGVCGGRLTALMWFYQSSVVDGRTDLEPAYNALKESRGILKKEAERRAVDDGIGTSVSVMNEHSTDLWDKLVDASETPDEFQQVHDNLYTDVQECLTLFFRKRPEKTDAAEEKDAAEKEDGSEAKEAE